MSTKAELREHLRAARIALTPAAHKSASEAVVSHLVSVLARLEAERVALYSAHGSELDVSSLCERDHRLMFAWPRVAPLPGPDALVFHYATLGSLRPGYRFLLEPAADHPLALDLDAVVTPALGFDVHGRRIGQGGGFYDRAIATFRAWPRPPIVIGVGFSVQVVDVLPDEPHDARVDMVVTEHGVVVGSSLLDPEPGG